MNMPSFIFVVLVFLSGIVKADTEINPDNWFKWVDAEIGYQVTPDVSIDCLDSGNDVDGKRHVAGFAALDANIYESEGGRFQFNARLWEHNSCDYQFDTQAQGGPGLYIKYRLWSK